MHCTCNIREQVQFITTHIIVQTYFRTNAHHLDHREIRMPLAFGKVLSQYLEVVVNLKASLN